MLPVATERLTPGLILGPFYPVQQPQDADHRLWRGRRLPQGARRLEFGGHVRTATGRPAAHALVELWHADQAGRYPHPAAQQCELVDPAFRGYGRMHTDSAGRFDFVSLVPGGYAAGAGQRAVHLHVQITGLHDRLLTQVFLPHDTTRSQDRWFAAATRREMLVARALSDDAGLLQLDWDAVIARG